MIPTELQRFASDRIAGAPISWGVCEVPDWGHQLGRDRVFREMRELGLRATEFGPDGFLPDSPQDRASYLAAFGLRAVGGFLPVVLHRDDDPLPQVESFIDVCIAAQADVVVLAAATGREGYDARPILDDGEWQSVLANLDRIEIRARERGVVAVIHPHIGTMVENDEDVRRVLDGSSIGLCVDTGHLRAAGVDPVTLTVGNPSRVKHVHLKDVDPQLATQVANGSLPFSEAVSRGMWTVLGEGSVDIEAMVNALEQAGYQGWYVLEQDLKLTHEPEGLGPAADVRRCKDYLERALEAAHARTDPPAVPR